MAVLADSNRVALRAVKESTFNTTPSAPLNIVRYVSHTLGPKSTYVTSNELRSDRQRTDTIRTGVTTDGEFTYELSYGGTGTNIGTDYFIEGALQSTWSSAVTATAATISCAAADNSINDSGAGLPNVAAGTWIVVKGFTTNGTKFFAQVVSRTASKIVVTGITLQNESAGASVTVAQDGYIRNGTTATSYTLETEFQDLTNAFIVMTGMRVSTMAMSVTAGAIITGSFGFMGSTTDANNTATVGTGAPNAAPTNSIMSAQSHVGAVYEGNTLVPTTDLFFKKIDININNNLRNQDAVANLYPVGIGSGTVDVTMSIDAYLPNLTLYDKFVSNTITGLALRLDGQDGGSYIIDMPQMRFTTGQATPGGINTDLMLSLTATAYLDPTAAYTIQITKLPL